MSLADRVAIVTGAARGIGRAIAERLAAEGATVVVNYVANRGASRDVVSMIEKNGGTAWAYRADVSRKSQVDRMVRTVADRFGRLDILVSNAGIARPSDFLDLTEESWDDVLDTNLKGTFLCSQAAARVMVERHDGGRIIAVSSISAVGAGKKLAHYSSSKAAQDMLMKCMALELGTYGITCNSVAPGFIITDLSRQASEDRAVREYWTSRAALGRLGNPSDVSGVVAFLASDDAAFVTGSFFVVDGGALYHLQ